jgi:hypothetical protein
MCSRNTKDRVSTKEEKNEALSGSVLSFKISWLELFNLDW